MCGGRGRAWHLAHGVGDDGCACVSWCLQSQTAEKEALAGLLRKAEDEKREQHRRLAQRVSEQG